MINQLAIVGVGLIGGSLGLAVRKAYPKCRVIGVGKPGEIDHRPVTAGAVDEMAATISIAVKDADLVVMCVPVESMPTALQEVAAHLKTAAIVTDVGSTKQSVVAAADALLIPIRFVGSHPIAGSDRGGFDGARADLFTSAACFVTHGPDGAANRIVCDFWSELGMRVMMTSPADHDLILASISHLPHVVAASLMSFGGDGWASFAGQGFRDTTRVAGGDPDLWTGILMDNRVNVSAAIDQLTAHLSVIRHHLQAGNTAALRVWLESAASRRRVDLPAGRPTLATDS